ncbi:MAG: alpha-D-ribose 1-methylphosphonate 5-phosphate C-P-lyase PhnJ [Pseudomonadota bacterium]
MSLSDLTKPWAALSYGFLDSSAKRELRRKMLKAVAVPGCQMPYASREVPMARGWGTGGLQVSLTLVNPRTRVKVIDQGADDSVNAASIRRFIARVAGTPTTTDTLEADLIQSRHRIPEEILRDDQVLVLQVPNPEPLRPVQPNMSVARQMHADADYGRMWLQLYEQIVRSGRVMQGASYPSLVHGRHVMTPSPIPRWDVPKLHADADYGRMWLQLYEQIVRSGRVMQGASYPSLVHGRHVMTPSPIPRWDVPKLHMAKHLTILSAGREKRIFAVPPFTRVEPLVFSDVPYKVEDHAGLTCHRSGAQGFFMNEIPQDDGSSAFEVSDSDWGVKAIRHREGSGPTLGETWYKDGEFKP